MILGIILSILHFLDENDWKGITSITDTTPGFKVVLSEGDMRLYEIEPID